MDESYALQAEREIWDEIVANEPEPVTQKRTNRCERCGREPAPVSPCPKCGGRSGD